MIEVCLVLTQLFYFCMCCDVVSIDDGIGLREEVDPVLMSCIRWDLLLEAVRMYSWRVCSADLSCICDYNIKMDQMAIRFSSVRMMFLAKSISILGLLFLRGEVSGRAGSLRVLMGE